MDRKQTFSNTILILTGMSGSGRSTVLRTLEDQGYETIDNLPISLLEGVCASKRGPEVPLAVAIDVRSRGFASTDMAQVIAQIKSVQDVTLVFLDADDSILEARFNQTRRRHPLASDIPLIQGIQEERDILIPLRRDADIIIDTSHYSLSDLKSYVRDIFLSLPSGELSVVITSFSYSRGTPRGADMVFDARLLKNPFYKDELKDKTGQDLDVQAFIRQDPDWQPFLDGLRLLIALSVPRFKKEGRKYLNIAVGCTGGKHRSVFTTEALSEWLRQSEKYVTINHRELQRDAS